MSVSDLDVDADDSASQIGTTLSCGNRSTRGRRKVLDGTLGANIDEAQVAEARAIVRQALKNPAVAMRLAYVARKGLKESKKLTGDDQILPSCVNKYDILGKDRSVEMALECEPALKKDNLDQITKKDVYEMQDFGYALESPCAVPSRRRGTCKTMTKERYQDLPGKRMANLIFVQKGDPKAPYVEIDWFKSGAFTKNLSKAKPPNQKILSLTHVSGTTAKLAPPLDASYKIINNNKDWEATLVSDKYLSEVQCWKVFEKEGKKDCLPVMLADERVGAPPVLAPKKKDKPLAIMDGSPGEASTPDSASSAAGELATGATPRVAPVARPQGGGGGARPSRPLKKRKVS